MVDGGESVRKAVQADATAVAEVWLRSRHTSTPAIPAPVHTDDEVRRWFATTVLPERDTWVIDADGAIVAVMVLEPGWVDQLYVDPTYMGRQLGSRLIQLAKELNPDGLDLWTFRTNTRARRFYERHSFVAVAMTEGHNEEGAPDVRYHWQQE